MANCQLPTQLFSHSPSAGWWGGEKIRLKSSWVETKDSDHHGRNKLDLEKINLLPITIGLDSGKQIN